MVMVSLRVGGRALPLAWRVKKTSGAIGFAEQRAALDRVAALLPAGVRLVLMGDRFYGSPALIAWCRAQGWDWRLRLKQDLLVFEDRKSTRLNSSHSSISYAVFCLKKKKKKKKNKTIK